MAEGINKNRIILNTMFEDIKLGCSSVFGQKVERDSISVFKKRDRPKFKRFLKKKI
jgi:hypothetical protein